MAYEQIDVTSLSTVRRLVRPKYVAMLVLLLIMTGAAGLAFGWQGIAIAGGALAFAFTYIYLWGTWVYDDWGWVRTRL